jgi:antitoxin (DNA-binding transcriptional repressor) of toxin-antitoxin stability system
VSSQQEITQHDLRNRSREIMDAIERGESFIVTRGGHQIGELIPLRQRRRFVTRQEFAAMSRNSPAVDLEAFRADQDAIADHGQSLSPKLTHLCSTVLSHGEGCAFWRR